MRDDKAISSFQALHGFDGIPCREPEISQAYPQQSVSGGLGSLFWMWLTALLGMSAAFVEELWLQIYKRRSDDGGCYGLVRPTIIQATGKHWLGILFAVFMIPDHHGRLPIWLHPSISLMHSVVVPAYSQNENLAKWIIGGVLAVLFFVCISSGGKQIAGITERGCSVHGILLHCGCRVRDRDPYHTSPRSVRRDLPATRFDVKTISADYGSTVMLGYQEVFSLTKPVLVQLRVRLVPAGVSHPVKQGLFRCFLYSLIPV